MWSLEDIIEFSKGIFPLYLCIVFPLLLMISPLPVAGSVEFPVFRLQQFELHGNIYGSQNNLVNVEARTVESGSLIRKCVIIRILSLTPSLYQQLIKEGVAAMLILLPSTFTDLTLDEKQLIWELEELMVDMEVQAAVYFAYESDDLKGIHTFLGNFSSTDKAPSAAAAMLNSLSSDGYQMVVTGSQNRKVYDSSISNVYILEVDREKQRPMVSLTSVKLPLAFATPPVDRVMYLYIPVKGTLSGYGNEEQLPTIAIVAHYDAFAAAPSLANGVDSNGSGVIALLEIARIFSKLFASSRTHPRVNFVFLLSGGGFVNYQGSKRFLEDQLDASDSPLLSELQFALCLDTLANGASLNLHVSKKPKEDTAGHQFWTSLEEAGLAEKVKVDMVHKKINLQEDRQSWEHEKFSIRRLPAFTLSRLNHSNSGERGSLMDTSESVDVPTLTRHVKVVVSALLKHVYGRSVEDALLSGLEVTEESVGSWMSLVASQPRSPQMLSGADNSFVSLLQQVLSRYASEVKVSTHKADPRDPEWVFYDSYSETMSAYTVKPAFFDFLLSLVIIGYLGAVYGAVLCFSDLYLTVYKSMITLKPVKTS